MSNSKVLIPHHASALLSGANDYFYSPMKGSHVIKYVPFGENSKLETLGRRISANTFHVEVATTLTLKLKTEYIVILKLQIITKP
jgi:hypothetical protein